MMLTAPIYLYVRLDNKSNGFFYKGTDVSVETKIVSSDWTAPPDYLWQAARFGLDGYDPLVPVIADEFKYAYLPWTPGVADWTSSNNVVNDQESGRKLDSNAPALVEDHRYLARMVIGVPLNAKISSTCCYQRIFQFKTGVYE